MSNLSSAIITPAAPVIATRSICVSDAILEEKAGLILRATSLPEITDDESMKKNVDFAKDLTAHLAALEASRVEVGKPFHEVWKTVNEIAKGHADGLLRVQEAVGRSLGAYETKRRLAVEAEQLRLQQEAAALELKRRQEQETAANGSDEAELDLLDKEAEIDAKQRELGQQALQVHTAAAVAKPTGARLTKDWDLKVTDIGALYAKHPQCVKMEIRPGAIKDLLKAGIEVPGIVATPTERLGF